MKGLIRPQRVAQEVQKKISVILQQEIKDPRLRSRAIVSYVEMSRDLAYSKVYVTFLNDQDKNIIKNSIKLLQKASGFIRYILGKTTYLRIVPELVFFYDSSMRDGMRISNLLSNLVE